jgi:hypothetical protein
MAIVVALAFAVGLFILTAGMWMAQRNVAGANRVSVQNQQAYFAGRAAMQHFLVKAKFLPTELYDAVAYTVGKNPLFSFSEYKNEDGSMTEYRRAMSDAPAEIAYTDAGSGQSVPIFAAYNKTTGSLMEPDRRNRARYLYMEVPGKPGVYFRLGSYYNSSYRFLNNNLVSNAPSRFQEVDKTKLAAIGDKRFKYLTYYMADCCTCATQPIVLTETLPGASPKTYSAESSFVPYDPGSPNAKRFPYTMQYKVVEAEIAAMQELRKYGEEAIKVSVEGAIKDFQKKEYTARQERTQKITRTGTL